MKELRRLGASSISLHLESMPDGNVKISGPSHLLLTNISSIPTVGDRTCLAMRLELHWPARNGILAWDLTALLLAGKPPGPHALL